MQSDEASYSPMHINGRHLVLSRDHVTVFVLFAINLLNYMDRFTVAAVMPDLQPYFKIDDVQVGLLQTVFICSYMIFAPVCGFLGDRYSRKIIMIVGIFVWSTTVLVSSFIPSNLFWLFFSLRGLVGIGEASYSTVAPVIIADLFVGEKRTKMLMLFFFAIPIGSGLGYVIGAHLATVFGAWQWGIRLTPLLGVACMLLLIYVVHEPSRGAAEKGTRLQASSWIEDVKYLSKNRSFILSSFGFVCIAFVSGAVSWWMPLFVVYAQSKSDGAASKDSINLIFGFITCVSGIVGVLTGSLWSARWQKTNRKAACYVCSIGLFLCTPFYFVCVNLFDKAIEFSWFLAFCAITCLCLNWAVLADLLLQIVVPPRRAMANAVQILFGHLLGDASSPYIIGYISESLLKHRVTPADHFRSLKTALLLPPFVLVFGGFFFLWCSFYVEKDKKLVEDIIAASAHDQVLTLNQEETQQLINSTEHEH